MHGLEKYYHYQEIPLGNIGNGLFNLKSNEFFINIPLINTIGEDPFSLGGKIYIVFLLLWHIVRLLIGRTANLLYNVLI